METIDTLVKSTEADRDARIRALGARELQALTPAAFASEPHPRTSPRYAFLSTSSVLDALMEAGFIVVGAAQGRSRVGRSSCARHVIRLRRRCETVQLTDSIPEIVLINGHDGRTACQFRLGVFRVICTNGLIVSIGARPVWRVPHRGGVLEDVVRAALEQCQLFEQVGLWIQRMEHTQLDALQRTRFAEQALVLRFPKDGGRGMQPEQLLAVRRPEDEGIDLWRTYNVIQENVFQGGLSRRSATNRLMLTRRITAIRETVQLNAALWDLATGLAV